MATMILADLGADVIKVEEPGGGQRAREERRLAGQPPFRLTPKETRWRTFSPLERNKRSITLDLHKSAGREIAVKLVKDADVVVEGFRPGVMARLGLDFDAVRAVNPRVVYCSVTGYGQSGPRSSAVGHDINYLAYAGALSLLGTADGRPIVPINLLADYAGGSLQAVVGILAALRARDQTGLGQLVDVSMTEGVLGLLSVEVARYLSSGNVPKAGNVYLTGAVAYYNVYETADRAFLTIACNEPHFYRALCALLGLPELAEEQFGDRDVQNRTRELLAQRFREHTLSEWTQLLTDKAIPFAPVIGIDEVLEDNHLKERGMFVQLDGGELGSVTQVNSAVHLSETPARVRHVAPMPGADTANILAELGFDANVVSQLAVDGVTEISTPADARTDDIR
jgi:crotonobetainyl-CoA:carnitine CoA-transferase CaiB-like acyl-CoA transferase